MPLILFLLSSISLAAIPTVEGLFRNGNSKTVTGNIALFTSMVLVSEDESLLKKSIAGSLSTEEFKNAGGHYMKFIFFKENERKINVLQVVYDSVSMNDSAISGVYFIPDLMKEMRKDQRASRSLFYSLMMMYGFNNSSGVRSVFKKYSEDFKANSEIMNQEKLKLYNTYRNYLRVLKKNNELKNELISPLRPKGIKEQKRINRLISTSMYKDTGHVSLIRDQNRFLWEVKMKNTRAVFSTEDHRLQWLFLNSPNGHVEVKTGDYFSFGGHDLPRALFIKDEVFKNFYLRILKARYYEKLRKTLPELTNDYMKKFKLRKIDPDDIPLEISLFYYRPVKK